MARGSHAADASLLAVCALIALTGCKSKASQGDKEESLELIGREIGLRFPDRTRLIGVHRERGVDDLIAVKVEMPATAWPGFVGQTPIDPTLFRPGERGLLGPDDSFWDPHRAKSLKTAETQLPKGRVLNLGYDDSNAAGNAPISHHDDRVRDQREDAAQAGLHAGER
jgi:hypothetical protein